MTDTCTRCDGCGEIADTDEGEPWTQWANLPLQSATAVLMGIVKPIPCPQCGGAGVVLNPDALPDLLGACEALMAVIREDSASNELYSWDLDNTPAYQAGLAAIKKAREA